MPKLIEIVKDLNTLNEELTIYAVDPWTPDSEAILGMEPDDAVAPPEAVAMGAQYFIDVYLAKEFLEGWATGKRKTSTVAERCARLIKYTINDA